MIINKKNMGMMLAQQVLAHQVHQKFNNEQPLLEGKLSFEKSALGLTVHCSDTVERQNALSSAKISPCISINILLEGKLAFSLGNKQYEFDNKNKLATLFINVIGQSEIFTRRITENQRVKKVNITIEKQWLLERSKSLSEQKNIEALFSNGVNVIAPELPIVIVEFAEKLLRNRGRPEVINQLKVDQLILEILAHCLPLLINDDYAAIANNKMIKVISKEDDFFKLFDDIVVENFSLIEIAEKLGVSISTLQRKVKSKYQLTAIEYMRHKKLDNAKTLLIIDGLSIGEIAFSAGYNHVSNFVTAFKKRFQITPAQLREFHLNN